MSSYYEKSKVFFDSRLNECEHFLSRFPGKIDFAQKRVLDLGAGHGALAFHIARLKPREIVGVDIDEKLHDFSKQMQAERFSDTQGVLRFELRDILQDDAELGEFDIVLSEATFEHIVDLDKYLAKVRDVLKPGGRLYTGYSPLYNAAWGDHGRLKAPLANVFPWSHLVFPQSWLLKRLSKAEGTNIQSLEDLGLNGYSFRTHERFLSNAGMKVVFFETNNQEWKLAKFLEPLRKLPVLRELLSYSIFAVLEKESV